MAALPKRLESQAACNRRGWVPEIPGPPPVLRIVRGQKLGYIINSALAAQVFGHKGQATRMEYTYIRYTTKNPGKQNNAYRLCQAPPQQRESPTGATANDHAYYGLHKKDRLARPGIPSRSHTAAG